MPEDHCGDENVGSPTGYRIKVFSRPFLDYPVPINSLPLHQDSDPGDKPLYAFRWTNKDVVLPCNWDWLKTAALQYETASNTGRGVPERWLFGRGVAVDTEAASTLSFVAERFSNAGVDIAGRTLIEPRDFTWCRHAQSDIPTMWGMQATCYEKISFCQLEFERIYQDWKLHDAGPDIAWYRGTGFIHRQVTVENTHLLCHSHDKRQTNSGTGLKLFQSPM